MMNKQKIIVLASVIILFAIAQYFVIEKVLDENQKKMSEIYQDGYDEGLKDTISALFQETKDCKITSVWMGNFSRQISDAKCIEKGYP